MTSSDPLGYGDGTWSNSSIQGGAAQITQDREYMFWLALDSSGAVWYEGSSSGGDTYWFKLPSASCSGGGIGSVVQIAAGEGIAYALVNSGGEFNFPEIYVINYYGDTDTCWSNITTGQAGDGFLAGSIATDGGWVSGGEPTRAPWQWGTDPVTSLKLWAVDAVGNIFVYTGTTP
jgi:hypothetical protein